MAMRDYTVNLIKSSPYFSIFPGGSAPVTTLATFKETMPTHEGHEIKDVYHLDWKRLDGAQRKLIIAKSAKQFHGATPAMIREHLNNGGCIPIPKDEVKE